MDKKTLLMLSSAAALVGILGCVTARTYVVNRARVDQEVSGQPKDAPVKTRKMIVVEIVDKDKPAAKAPQVASPAAVADAPVAQDNFTLPQSAPVPSPAAMVVAPVQPLDYVVEKDDTLQKIAKKLYGSYSQWTKIYAANRDVIKDPNFLRPGTLLKVPQAASSTPTTN